MRDTALIISDTHCGMMAGAIAPGTKLTYIIAGKTEIREKLLSDWSKWIWDEVINPTIELAIEFAGSDPMSLIHVGDVVHGDLFPGYLYSPFPDHQENIAAGVLSEFRRIPTLRDFLLIHGTAEHEFGQGAATNNIGSKIAPWGYGVNVIDFADYRLGGVSLDIAHHGPPCGAPNNRGGPVRLYARTTARGYLERGERAPDVILRGHVHDDYYETVEVPWGNHQEQVLIAICPPLCGPNEYAVKATRSQPRARCGAYLLEVDNGKVKLYDQIVERSTRKTILVNRAYNSGKYSQEDGQLTPEGK